MLRPDDIYFPPFCEKAISQYIPRAYVRLELVGDIFEWTDIWGLEYSLYRKLISPVKRCHSVTSSFFGIGILLVSDLLDFRYFGRYRPPLFYTSPLSSPLFSKRGLEPSKRGPLPPFRGKRGPLPPFWYRISSSFGDSSWTQMHLCIPTYVGGMRVKSRVVKRRSEINKITMA